MKRLIPLLLTLVLASCSPGGGLRARELNSLEPVETLCVALEDGRVKIYACAAVRDEDNVPLTFEMDGDTVEDAVRKLQRLPEGRDALFIHTKNLVFDTRYCAERREELISYLRDSKNVRASACVFCADGVKALLDSIREGGGDVSSDLEFLAEHFPGAEAVTRAGSAAASGEILAVGEQYGSVIPLGIERF